MQKGPFRDGCENMKTITTIIQAILEKGAAPQSKSLEKNLTTLKLCDTNLNRDVAVQNRILEKISNRFYPENQRLISHEGYFHDSGPVLSGMMQKNQRLSKIFG